MQSRLAQLDQLSDEHDDLSLMFADAQQLAIDGDGRIVLPDTLKEHARISDEAAFVGLGAKFQMWEPAALRQRHRDASRERALRQRRAARYRQAPPRPVDRGRAATDIRATAPSCWPERAGRALPRAMAPSMSTARSAAAATAPRCSPPRGAAFSASTAIPQRCAAAPPGRRACRTADPDRGPIRRYGAAGRASGVRARRRHCARSRGVVAQLDEPTAASRSVSTARSTCAWRQPTAKAPPTSSRGSRRRNSRK